MLFVMFQAVFAWAQAPIGWIEAGVRLARQTRSTRALPAGFLRSLIVDGVIAGVGAVVVFLPQILILFFFILRARGIGLYGPRRLPDGPADGAASACRAARSSRCCRRFACAVPGIMATRTIDDEKDRLTTILIAPLMTCSARLPVYTLIIGALIPNTRVLPFVGLQGLVLFGALCARHRRRVRRRAGAAPDGDQGRVVGLHDGDAQISDGRGCATSRSGCGAAR